MKFQYLFFLLFIICSSCNKISFDRNDIFYKNQASINIIDSLCLKNKNLNTSTYIKPLVISHISDIHGSNINMENFINFTNQIAPIKIGIITGDIMEHNTTSDYEYFIKSLRKSQKPIYITPGNHDVGETSDPQLILNNTEVYKRYISPINIKIDNQTPYYYEDIDESKVRIISIYDFESNSSYNGMYKSNICYSNEQIKWLITTLETTPQDFGIIIMKHIPECKVIINSTNTFQNRSMIESNFPFINGIKNGGTPIADIIDAFKNKDTISKKYYTVYDTEIIVNADFTKLTNQEFICYMSGHLHTDTVGFLIGHEKQLDLNITSSNIYCLSDYNDLKRNNNDKSNDAFNVYFIDRNTKKISIIRIGADETINNIKRDSITISYI